MEPDWWLELESNYTSRLDQRKELYKQYGNEVLAKLPGSEPACNELMEMCLQFLVARYPQHFTLDPVARVFRNGITRKTFNLNDLCPLMVLLDNIPEDFAVMTCNPETGEYELRAGFICSSLGWTVQTKLGKPLREIHAPIPDYKEKLERSMDRFDSFAPVPGYLACC
jgi:hypothetical protein